MTGMDLRLERVKAGVTVTAQAKRMGLSRVSVHKYERAETVRDETAMAYLRALRQERAA